ncbi:MAG: TetR/AcrR family transcriptional regulator [Solirubrobacterales bacterium]
MSAPARREQLLDVTTRIVADQGFKTVTIEAVATEAGISRAIVYGHFDDLDGLLKSVIDREMSRALAEISESTLQQLTDGSPIEIMLESLDHYLGAVQAHPDRWRLVLMPPEGAPEILRKQIADGRARILIQMVGAVGPVLEGEGNSTDAELTARVLSAISDEYARLMLDDPERYPPERLLTHARWVLEQAQLK